MFDAGAIVFSIRAAGAQVFEQDLQRADKAVDGFGKSSKDAADKTESLGKSQDKTSEQTRKHQKAQEDAARKAAEYADAQQKVGTVLVTAGAAIVATTALTVRSAIQWESAWAGVTKTVDGTAEELAEVEGGLRGLTSVLPASHDEIAAVAEAAGQLGVETPNVVAFTRTMIDLGETTNLSANDAATALARFMNVMGTAQGEVSNLGSAVVELGNNYATTEAEIVNMATRLSGAARQVGLTEGETLGLATALSSVGIEAEAGGSAVSKVMIDIAASVEEGGDRVEQFAKVAGVSAQDFTKQWKTDPGAALAGFVKGLADAEAQGSSTLGILAELGITETRMRDALLRAAAASDEFTAAMGMGNDAYAENNALQAEAAKRYETVESQLGIMRNRINDAAIDLGSVFLPAVADAAGAIGDFADGVASLPAPLQEAVVIGGLLIGTVALLGGTALIAVPKIVALWGQIRLLTAAGTGARTALSRTAAFLGGPWGIALVAATALMMTYNKAVEEGIPAQEEVTNKILSTADATEKLGAAVAENKFFPSIDENTRRMLEDLPALLDQGAEASENWFVGLMKSSTASDQAFDALNRYGESLGALVSTDLPSASAGFRQLVEDFNLTDEQALQLLKQMDPLRTELLKLANDTGVAGEDVDLLNMLLEDSTDESKTAARAYIEAADSVSQLSQDLDQLIDVLNEANGIGQDAITTNIDYQQALADVDEQIKNAKAGVEGYALGLDESTQAGRDNMAMLVDLAKDAWDAAEAQYALDGNTDAYRQRLEGSRQALLDRIHELGLSGDAAEDLADQIMNIPSETEWKVIADTAEAQWTIDRFLTANASKRINIAVGAGGTGGITQADGGVIESYADGGVRENHVAQMARAGAWRVWAEPETGGETYVPHALSKRARSEQIMAETAEIFGGTYIPGGARRFADGATVAAGAPASVAGPLIGQLTLQSTGDVREDLEEVNFYLRTINRGGRR